MFVEKRMEDGGTIDRSSGWTQVEVDAAQHLSCKFTTSRGGSVRSTIFSSVVIEGPKMFL